MSHQPAHVIHKKYLRNKGIKNPTPYQGHQHWPWQLLSVLDIYREVLTQTQSQNAHVHTTLWLNKPSLPEHCKRKYKSKAERGI